MPVPAPVMTIVRDSGIGILRAIEDLAVGADRKVRQLIEGRTGIAEDLAVAAVLLQVDQYQAQGGDDLFAPDEQVQLLGDLVVMATVGIAQALLYALEALPGIELIVEINVLVHFAGAIAIQVAQPDQFSGRRVWALAFLPRGGRGCPAGNCTSTDVRGLPASARLYSPSCVSACVGMLAITAVNDDVAVFQDQAHRPRLTGFALDEIDQIQARTHGRGAVRGRSAGVTVSGVPAQFCCFEAMLDLPAVSEVQREGVAVEIGEVGQDKSFWGPKPSARAPTVIQSDCVVIAWLRLNELTTWSMRPGQWFAYQPDGLNRLTETAPPPVRCGWSRRPCGTG